MGIEFYSPAEFKNRTDGKIYDIPKKTRGMDILYDKEIQRTSINQDNIAAVFNKWFISFFDNNYFRHIHVKTQSTYMEFKSYMKSIYKKDQPNLVIDPNPPEIVEDFIFSQNMTNRFNPIEPGKDNISAKLLYALPVVVTDKCEIHFRRNRLRFNFDILIMEETHMRQLNTYNMLVMNIRHNSKFMLERVVPQLIPTKYINHIADIHGYEATDEKFLTFLNSNSNYPIVTRSLPNGDMSFFMEQNIHIQVEVPDLPDKDAPEMSEAYEIAARVTDRFTFIVDLPMEFIFLVPEEFTEDMKHTLSKEDPHAAYMSSPLHADLNWPTVIGEYKITNRLTLMLDEDDEPVFDIFESIQHHDNELFGIIRSYCSDGIPITDMVCVRVYPNGSYNDLSTEITNTGLVTIIGAEVGKLYTANVYVNRVVVNAIRTGENKTYAGTVEID